VLRSSRVLARVEGRSLLDRDGALAAVLRAADLDRLGGRLSLLGCRLLGRLALALVQASLLGELALGQAAEVARELRVTATLRASHLCREQGVSGFHWAKGSRSVQHDVGRPSSKQTELQPASTESENSL
jgi:hypothetical protein